MKCRTPEETALADLVDWFADHEPHFGYASSLLITSEQAATVIEADHDAANDVADAFLTGDIIRLLRVWPGEQARELAVAIVARAVVLAREGAARALLQLVNAESERRDEERRSLTPLDAGMEPVKEEF